MTSCEELFTVILEDVPYVWHVHLNYYYETGFYSRNKYMHVIKAVIRLS